MRMLIYLVVTVVGVLVTLFGVAGLVGSFLPATHTASASVEVAAPIDQVWAALDDVQAFPSWLPEISKIELLPDRNGHRTFRQQQGRNSFVLEETAKQPPTLVTRTIADDNNFFSGSWEHRLEDLGNGRTRVTLTETGTVSSPIPRAIMRYAVGYDFYLKKFTGTLRSHFGA